MEFDWNRERNKIDFDWTPYKRGWVWGDFDWTTRRGIQWSGSWWDYKRSGGDLISSEIYWKIIGMWEEFREFYLDQGRRLMWIFVGWTMTGM